VIEHSQNSEAWELMRIVHLGIEQGASLDCGTYGCSPKGGGFRAKFDLLRIERK
jgi:regulation of enolase protein 1 (concanavalin A-like superfamily)